MNINCIFLVYLIKLRIIAVYMVVKTRSYTNSIFKISYLTIHRLIAVFEKIEILLELEKV
jgi:hypothetical protein